MHTGKPGVATTGLVILGVAPRCQLPDPGEAIPLSSTPNRFLFRFEWARYWRSDPNRVRRRSDDANALHSLLACELRGVPDRPGALVVQIVRVGIVRRRCDPVLRPGRTAVSPSERRRRVDCDATVGGRCHAVRPEGDSARLGLGRSRHTRRAFCEGSHLSSRPAVRHGERVASSGRSNLGPRVHPVWGAHME
jgi:hypothetical protein